MHDVEVVESVLLPAAPLKVVTFAAHSVVPCTPVATSSTSGAVGLGSAPLGRCC